MTDPHVCRCHCAAITELQVAIVRLIGDLDALRLNVEATTLTRPPVAVTAERERLFVAIRHAISLDKPWRGEALDVIDGVWREGT